MVKIIGVTLYVVFFFQLVACATPGLKPSTKPGDDQSSSGTRMQTDDQKEKSGESENFEENGPQETEHGKDDDTTAEPEPPTPLTDEEMARELNLMLEKYKLHVIDYFAHASEQMPADKFSLFEQAVDVPSFIKDESDNEPQMGLPALLAYVLDNRLKNYKLKIYGYDDLMNVSHKVTSKKRAEAVLDMLQQNGFNSQNYKIYGMGDKNPVKRGFNKDGYDPNRRVELKIER